ncbi:hypothetical protein BH23ACT10_BH23ACT10_13160 [soil metagenome]
MGRPRPPLDDMEETLAVVSADADFARFSDVRWINPLDQSVAGEINHPTPSGG